jgi:hypothetical protein
MVGFIVIVAVLSPELHAYLVPPDVVSVTLALSQTIPSSFKLPEVSITVMTGVGNGFTVIVVVADAVQPSALVTVTVYVELAIGVTVITLDVSAVFQR